MSQNELNHMVQEVQENSIVGKCCLADGKYRWILLADQNVFDNLNISIIR